MSVLLLAIVIVVFVIVWYYRQVGRIAYYLRNIPAVPTRPLLGNLNLFMNGLKIKDNFTSEFLNVFDGLQNNIYKNESIFVFWRGWQPLVLLCSPQKIQNVLSSMHVIEKSSNYHYLYPWLGTGLLTSGGDKWKIRRKLLTPTFHFKILDDFIPIINEHSMTLVEYLRENSNNYVEITNYITRCALDIICETAMGVKIEAQSKPDSDYMKALSFVAEMFLYRNLYFIGWFDFIFYKTSVGKEYVKNLKVLHEFTRSVIRDRKKEMIENKDKNIEIKDGDNFGIKKRSPFLDSLLEHHLASHTKLTEEDIREEVDTFMFEGHDTTAMAISWSLYLIGLYPEIQEKLHLELDTIFGDDKTRYITNEDLKQLKYLECCIKESLRLYPSVPIIARHVINDFKLDEHIIPKGSTIAVNVISLHKNPNIYPNPNVYNPDRFLPENSSSIHPYAYIPFSAGPRNCIGQRFAISEEKIVIANVLRNYKLLSFEHRDKMIHAFELVTRPKTPLRINFKQL